MADNKTKKVPANGHNADDPNVWRNKSGKLLNKYGQLLIGGDNSRIEYLKRDKKLNAYIHVLSKEYGLSPELIYNIISREGVIDQQINRINLGDIDIDTSLIDSPGTGDGFDVNMYAEYGLDDAGTYLKNGLVKPIKDITYYDLEATNEKGRNVLSASVGNHPVALELLAATLKNFQDTAKKNRPNASKNEINALVSAMYNMGPYHKDLKYVVEPKEGGTSNSLWTKYRLQDDIAKVVSDFSNDPAMKQAYKYAEKQDRSKAFVTINSETGSFDNPIKPFSLSENEAKEIEDSKKAELLNTTGVSYSNEGPIPYNGVSQEYYKQQTMKNLGAPYVPKYSVGGDIQYGSQYTADKIKGSDVNAGAFTALNLLKGGASGALAGAGLGATFGSIAPGIGTAIGAGIGLLVGGIQSIFGINKKKKLLAQAKEANRVATIANMSQKAENDVYNLRQNTQVANGEPVYYAFGGRYPRVVRFANGGVLPQISRDVTIWGGGTFGVPGAAVEVKPITVPDPPKIEINNPYNPTAPTPTLDPTQGYGWEIDNGFGHKTFQPIPVETSNSSSNVDSMGNKDTGEWNSYSGYITDQLTKINIDSSKFKHGDEFSEAIAAIASMQGEGTLDNGDYNQFAKTARDRYAKVLKKIESERKAIRDMRYDEFGNYIGTADEIDNQPIEQVAAFGGRFNPIGYRYIGRRFAAGGMVPNSSDTMVAYGATHEQMDPQTGETGVPYQNIEVEGGGVVGNRALAGEVVKQDPNGDIVFSDRLYVPGSKVTYADFAKAISDRKGVIEKEIESQSAELDKILKANNKSRTTIAKQGSINRNIEKIMTDINVKTAELQQYDNKLNELYGIQEQHATAMGLRDNTPVMACGGRARRRYSLGGIVLGAQTLGGITNFITNLSEAKFYSKLTPPQQTRETAPEYDWRYNISSQLEDINRQVGSTRNFIERNTSNAQVARNLITNVAIQGNAARNKLYAEKNRAEQLGRNRNIEARYQTNLRNAEKEYQNAVDKYNHSVQANSIKADATRTFLTDMMGVIQTGIGLYEGEANRRLIAATSISDKDAARLAKLDFGEWFTGKTKEQRVEARAARRAAKKGGSATTTKSKTFSVPSVSDYKYNLSTGNIQLKSRGYTFGNIQSPELNLQYSRIPKELLRYRYLYNIPSFK